jgi:hypothetical protein
MATEDWIYGPFVHGLNKGGLDAILVTSKLKGTGASNHMASDLIAVRAYVGDFEYQRRNKNWHGREKIFIEFMTRVPPRTGLPPGYAEWSDAELVDGFLPVHVLRVLNGEGESLRRY